MNPNNNINGKDESSNLNENLNEENKLSSNEKPGPGKDATKSIATPDLLISKNKEFEDKFDIHQMNDSQYEDDIDPIEFLEKVINKSKIEEDLQESESAEVKKIKAIYLLPNLVTSAALLSGFSAVLAGFNGRFEHAAILIFLAMLLDGLDGRVARMTNTQSHFGEQYDSLADMVSFGVAPALVMYQWSLHTVEATKWLPEKLAWMIPFVYCACAALRLARFNVQVGKVDSRYFVGLPSPAAAGLVAGFVWFGAWHEISGSNVLYFSLLLTFYAGIMMVAPIKYFSFKKINLNRKISLFLMSLIVLTLAIIRLYPPVLWLIFLAYSVHGPILKIYKLRKATAKIS